MTVPPFNAERSEEEEQNVALPELQGGQNYDPLPRLLHLGAQQRRSGFVAIRDTSFGAAWQIELDELPRTIRRRGNPHFNAAALEIYHFNLELAITLERMLRRAIENHFFRHEGRPRGQILPRFLVPVPRNVHGHQENQPENGYPQVVPNIQEPDHNNNGPNNEYRRE
ncbi:unnamed protein product [Caenorhabditis auriculariae]|uniref:Uncharacterized protein n=1 Tax=Caenorhabditis auriculariae TaxID=2777116 RepID=A0A8S1H4Z0_9PELO|nr:unnamed protein product [Caenorhabditis auriculariae]